VEPNRPDLIDDLISAVMGQARPVVDAAIDKAALMVLGVVRQAADEMRDNPATPGAFPGALDSNEIYALGWDDALTALIVSLDGMKRRIAPHE